MTDPADLPDVDIEALDLGAMGRHARKATFAVNWKSVLAADAFVGVLIAAIGYAISLWVGWLGWLIIAAGVIYILLVGRRFLQWRWLRNQAGL